MAKASKPSGIPRETTYRRLNRTGLIILGGVLLLGLVSFVPIMRYQDRAARASALQQAQASVTGGDVDLALRNLQAYLGRWPNDPDGLKLQAKLLFETARSLDQFRTAAQANDQLLRLNPNGSDGQEIRRRLIQLYLHESDEIRRFAETEKQRGSEDRDLRYRTAATIARDVIRRGAKDSEIHRWLGMALQGMIAPGDKINRDEAISEYQKAIEIDSGDTEAVERLAGLQFQELKDPALAQATMDALLKAKPDSVATRLARYRYYLLTRNAEKSLAEIDAASTLAPHDLEVQQIAANDAIRRQDFARARAHIDAIPATDANQLQIRTLRGTLDLSEAHPDEAVDEWRKGLLSVGGSNTELTWRLAYTLIELGRLGEARQSIGQFQRLAGEDKNHAGRFLRALYEQRGGHPKAALKDLERVVDQLTAVYKPDAYLTIGRCHEALNEQGQAMLAYQKAAALVPNSPLPRREIARLLGINNPADAINEMERALAQNPKDLPLILEVARMRFNQQLALPKERRLWGGVEDLINRAMAIDPGNIVIQTLQADALAATDQLDQAIDMLRRSVAGTGKKKPEIWVTYAGALDRAGQREEALQVLERASAPDAAGDHAILRTARAKVLTRLNRAQAARDVLTKDRDKIPKSERPDLARTLAELCRELGDRQGTRDALAEWAKMVPDKADPGLALLAFAQTYNDDEAARLGLEALRTVGGDVEPYGLAARALELLRIDRPRITPAEPTAPTDPAELKRLDEADRLVAQLNTEAPQLAVVPMLQGLIAERRGKTDEAIDAYRRSLKDESMTPALARLVELLSRRDRFDEIAQLKARFAKRAASEGTPSLLTSFDQINAEVFLKLGDKQRAEKAVAEMVEAQPDSLPARASQVRLLSSMGKNTEAEASLRDLAKRRPNDPAPWIALVAFRVQNPDLGPSSKLLQEIQDGYKGPHPELLQARCLWVLNEIPDAVKKYDAALAQNGDDMTTLHDVAEFDESNNRAEEAKAVLRRAVKKDPKAPWASRGLAMNLTAQPGRGDWQEAWSLIKPGAPGSGETPEDRLIRATVLARAPEVADREQAVPTLIALANDLPASNAVAVEARVRLAQAFLAGDQSDEAARFVAPVADDTNRPNAIALALSVEALSRSRDFSSAKERLDRLETLEPKSPRTAAAKVWYFQKSGKPAEALAVVNAAYTEAEKSENGEGVALAYQDLLRKVGNDDGALKLAERITARWPRDAYILALAHLDAGQVADAIKYCRLAIQNGEINETSKVALRIAIAQRQDPAVLQAIDEIFTAALAKESKNAQTLNFFATVRHLQGRYAEEVELYRQAMENSPVSYEFLNNMAWTLSEGLQRYDEALKRVDDVIRREGNNPQFLDTRGVILGRLGRLDDAISDLETSVKTYPLATTYFHLARTYLQVKKLDEYRRCRDMARQLKLDVNNLDPTDKADVTNVMNGS